MTLDFSRRAYTAAQAVRSSFGVALIICGQPVAWALRGSFAGGRSPLFPAAPIIIGLLLLVQGRWVRESKLQVNPAIVMAPVLLLFVPTVAMTFVSLKALMVFAAYPACLAVMALAIAYSDTEDFALLPMTVTIVGFASSLAPFLQIAFFGLGDSSFLRLSVQGADVALLTADLGGMTMLAALIVGFSAGRDKAFVGVFAAISFVTSAAAVFFSSTRSDMIFLAICIPVYLFGLRSRTEKFYVKSSEDGKGSGRKRRAGFILTVLGMLILAPAAFGAFFGSDVLAIFFTNWNNRIFGALDFASDGGASGDVSSSIHWSLLQYSWDRLDPWGHGIMAQQLAQGEGLYPHLSYLQAYYDLGFLGGTIFLLVALIVPSALIVLKLRERILSPTDTLIILLFIYAQGDHLMHAAPYSWVSLVPIALVYSLLARFNPQDMSRPSRENFSAQISG